MYLAFYKKCNTVLYVLFCRLCSHSSTWYGRGAFTIWNSLSVFRHIWQPSERDQKLSQTIIGFFGKPKKISKKTQNILINYYNKNVVASNQNSHAVKPQACFKVHQVQDNKLLTGEMECGLEPPGILFNESVSCNCIKVCQWLHSHNDKAECPEMA